MSVEYEKKPFFQHRNGKDKRLTVTHLKAVHTVNPQHPKQQYPMTVTDSRKNTIKLATRRSLKYGRQEVMQRKKPERPADRFQPTHGNRIHLNITPVTEENQRNNGDIESQMDKFPNIVDFGDLLTKNQMDEDVKKGDELEDIAVNGLQEGAKDTLDAIANIRMEKK